MVGYRAEDYCCGGNRQEVFARLVYWGLLLHWGAGGGNRTLMGSSGEFLQDEDGAFVRYRGGLLSAAGKGLIAEG